MAYWHIMAEPAESAVYVIKGAFGLDVNTLKIQHVNLAWI
jgi:hypothetical protein